MQQKTNDMRFQKSAGPQGFSLVELMVVLVILAILAAIQYPSYLESVRKTKRAEGRSALLQLMQQQERYYSQYGSYIEFSSITPNGYRWYSGSAPASSSYEISATVCKEDAVDSCILLTAKPGTKNVNAAFKDDACGELTLSSNGMKDATGYSTQCW